MAITFILTPVPPLSIMPPIFALFGATKEAANKKSPSSESESGPHDAALMLLYGYIVPQHG